MIVCKTIMFVVMAFVNPNPGQEEEMANRIRSFRNVLQTKSGLVKTFVLMERDRKELVGVSMWTNEAAYQGAIASYASVSPKPASRSVERESTDDA